MLVERFGGCDEYFTEMINAPSLLNMGPFEKFYLLDGPEPKKIVWQLTGNKKEKLAEAAYFLAAKNGIGIDLNMGCCAPQIYSTGAGIAWMLKDLKETEATVKAVKERLNDYEKETGKHVRLSVKCRLGGEDFTEKSFFNFAEVLVKNGVELISLHPRTIKEKERNLPRWEWGKKLYEHFGKKIPVYLNGCIKDETSAKKALAAFPEVAGLMISRAAAQEPWIFARLSGKILEQSQIDAEELALAFIDYVEEFQPKEFYKTRLQRFFSYYCKNFSFAHYFSIQMLNCSTLEESRNSVKEYFAKQGSDRILQIKKETDYKNEE